MKIDYDSVRRNAKKLRGLADNCEAAAKTCKKYQNELPQYWQGNAADAYIQKLVQLNQRNTALAKDIEHLASQITMVANEMEETDRELARKIAARSAAKAVSTAGKAASAASAAVSKVSGGSVSANKSGTAKKTNTSTLASTVSSLLSGLFGKR